MLSCALCADPNVHRNAMNVIRSHLRYNIIRLRTILFFCYNKTNCDLGCTCGSKCAPKCSEFVQITLKILFANIENNVDVFFVITKNANWDVCADPNVL